jgi:hypothetical protein
MKLKKLKAGVEPSLVASFELIKLDGIISNSRTRHLITEYPKKVVRLHTD